MMHGLDILSLLIWLPIGGGALLLVLGDQRATLARWCALIVALVTFVLCLPLWQGFDTATASFQYVERLSWIMNSSTRVITQPSGSRTLVIGRSPSRRLRPSWNTGIG